jgi:hypothetical protein
MSLGDAGLSFRIVFSGQEHANPAHPLSLLRVRSSRPCDRNAAKPSHEMTPPHSTLASSLTGSVSDALAEGAPAMLRRNRRP